MTDTERLAALRERLEYEASWTATYPDETGKMVKQPHYRARRAAQCLLMLDALDSRRELLRHQRNVTIAAVLALETTDD